MPSVARTPIVAGIRLSASNRERIERAGGRIIWEGTLGAPHGGDTHPVASSPGLAEALSDAEVWLGPGVSGEVLSRATGLQWVQSTAAGVENFVSPELATSPVQLTNVRGMHARTTAEHAMSLVLALSRSLPREVRAQADGEWRPLVADDVHPIAGTRVLVVGTGNIGRAIADRLRGFEAEVIGVSRSGEQAPGFSRVGRSEALNDEIGACRWLVVAAPATPATHHLIAKATFDAMNAGTVLVNVARGSLVDEQELASALADGRLAAAGLDVFEHEPLPAGSPLWTMDNVLITAHAGGVMDGYDDAAVGYFVGNLARYRSGEPLHSVVDKAAGY